MAHRSNIGENLTREAIAAGAEDDLRTLVDQLYSVRNAAPDWFMGSLSVMIDVFLVARSSGCSVVAADPEIDQFLRGSRERMILNLMLAVNSRNDNDLLKRQTNALISTINQLLRAGASYQFNAQPMASEQSAGPFQITVLPAPVTINAFPSQAIQTVERDSQNEIVATVTTYV